MQTVEDKNVIVTGAASGIGRESARLLASHDANVVIADIDPDGTEEAAESIQEVGSGETIGIVTDVSDEEAVTSLISQTVDQFGSIDVLYNNAGIPQQSTPVEDIDIETWEQNQQVNLKSVFLTTKHAVPYMREAGGGVILNQSSVAALRPRDGLAPYVAAKGGVISLSKQLAYELASDNIRVNAICPGATNTDMLPKFTSGDLSMEEYESSVPLGRLLEVDDIANAILFLSSEEAKMITGVALPVDGGRSI
ncbi:SDR family NAD(P)-dependent oxidoreductase [Halobellus marinus]|uniref:SDR family NAD(P)-dependent oxidoreductase n=1 Tax=Halobellus TaxID=1073986 RepID=UPI0028AF83B0|nr:SDR family oxidoreductase [Halobellus sp. DFY28]